MQSDPKGKMRCLFSPPLIFTPLFFGNPDPEAWGEVADSNCCVSKTHRLHVAAIYGLGGKMMGLSPKSRQPSRLRAPLRRPQPKHFMGWGSQVTNCQNRAQGSAHPRGNPADSRAGVRGPRCSTCTTNGEAALKK